MSDTAGDPTCACRDCNQAELLKVMRRRRYHREIAGRGPARRVAKQGMELEKRGTCADIFVKALARWYGHRWRRADDPDRKKRVGLPPVVRLTMPYMAIATGVEGIALDCRAPPFLPLFRPCEAKADCNSSDHRHDYLQSGYLCAFARMRADTDNSTPSPIRPCRRAKYTA